MRMFLQHQNRWLLRLGLWAAAITLLCTPRFPADSFAPDPVDELRFELRASTQDLLSRYPDLIKKLDPSKPEQERKILNDKRETILMTKLDALRTIPEMRRALLLNAWRLDEKRDDMAPVDRKVRNILIGRLQKAVRNVLQHGSSTARLAVINNIAEIGPSARNPEDRLGIGRDFGPDLAEEIKAAKSPAIRSAAARALGQIFPDPKLAARALGDLLATGNAEERRSAVVGLIGMMRVATQLATSNEAGGKVELLSDRTELAAAGKAALPVAGKGLSDADPEVRRLSAEVFQLAASALANTIPQQPTGEESLKSNLNVGAVQAARTELRPLMDAFKEQAPQMAKGLADQGSSQVRALIARALEDIALARNLLERAARGEALPPPRGPISGTGLRQDTPKDDRTRYAVLQGPAPAPVSADDPLLDTLRANVPALARAAADPSVEVRLKALDAIETIGRPAVAASPALVNDLEDSNLFVRWAAARALGKVGTNDVARAIPALARLLQDRDIDVNIAAARALDRFGPDAKAAVPELILALSATDEEKKKEVLATLQSIGTDASPAIPAVTELLLNDAEAPIRQAAARLLGKFGPAAAQAIPSLQQALVNDPDPDVRRAASDALLNIEQK